MSGPGKKDGETAKPVIRAGQEAGSSRMGILEELADYCLAAGEFGSAADYYEQMIALAQRLGGDPRAKAEVVRKMATCLRASGEYDRALSFLQEAAGLLEDAGEPVALAEVLADKAWIAVRLGDYPAAERDGLRALELVRDQTRERASASALNCLGTVALRRGEWERAREIYEGALALYRQLGDEDRVARCLNNLGLVAKNLGRWDQALEYQRSAAGISRRLGNEGACAGQLNNLGITLFKRGEWDEARKVWQEARGILEHLGEKWEIAHLDLNLGNYERRVRHLEEAEAHYRRALETSERNGDVRGRALALEFLGGLAADRGEAETARALYTEALSVATGIAPKGDLVFEIQRNFAEMASLAGDHEFASSLAHQALALAVAAGDTLEEACLLRVLGRVSAGRGDMKIARDHLERSITCLDSIGERFESARSRMARAELGLLDRGELPASLEAIARARDLLAGLRAEFELAAACVLEARLAARTGDGRRAREALEEGRALFAGGGWPEPAETIREVHREMDRNLATVAVSEANDLAAFVRLSGEISSLTDAQERARRILAAIGERCGAQRGRLVMLARSGDPVLVDLRWEASASEVPAGAAVARRALALAAAGNAPIVSTHPAGDPRLASVAPPREVLALLAVPLRVEGRALGGVYLERCVRPAAFAQSEIDLAVALTHLASSCYREIEMTATPVESAAPMASPRARSLSPFPYIVTRNAAMLELLDTVRKIQPMAVTVLIHGETGTGKELIAKALHGDPERPFVTINCAAMAEGILESELFGHVKGAFTDAHRDKEGLFARAAGGTVFLDEIDKTSRNFQERLLGVVDKREYRPVGSDESRRADFRVICATNQDLARAVAEGRFLKDLFYRLKVVYLTVPPLRERRDDVPILAEHFLAEHSLRLGRRDLSLRADALQLLAIHPWPGNVRDLEHEIERVVAFSPDGTEIGAEALSAELRSAAPRPSGSGDLPRAVEELEVQLIREALHRYGGNRSRAARSLGLSRRGLLNKIQRYRLDSARM